ncbi:44575_t:CDS:2, partial [Gigaspora margarita]
SIVILILTYNAYHLKSKNISRTDNSDFVSSEEYDSDDLTPVNYDDKYDFQEDDYFQKKDINGANLVISRLLAALAANFKKKTCPATYISNSKRTRQRKNKLLREVAVGFLKISQFFFSANNNTDMINEGILIDRLDSNEIISETIEFVNDVIREEQLSDAEKAHYIAVLYFLWLLLKGEKKIEVSETVAKVVSSRP